MDEHTQSSPQRDGSWKPGKDSRYIQEMFGSIARRYDVANSALSLGIHKLWRQRLLSRLNADPNEMVLDVCTGTGDLLPLIRSRGYRVVGADFCYPMLATGKTRAGHASLPVVQADALNLPFSDNSFSAVSVAFGVRNFEDLHFGLRELQRVLKPGGTLLVLEFGQPTWPIFSHIYRWYSRAILPKIGAALTGNPQAYLYLPETAERFPCNRGFEEHLRACNLVPQSSEALTGGIAWLYEAKKL